MRIEDGGIEELSLRSRGTPRIANRLLRRVRDYAEVRADGLVTRELTRTALELYEVDELGLDRLDRAVLDALIRRFGGGPVGLSTLAVAVAEEAETVEVVAEPFLVRHGLLAQDPARPGGDPGGLGPPGAHPAPVGRSADTFRLSGHAKPQRRPPLSVTGRSANSSGRNDHGRKPRRVVMRYS